MARTPGAATFKGIFCHDISEIAVGTLITERPPHRTVRAQFGHTACMGVSLSRVHHAIFCRALLLHSFVRPARREQSSVPTAYYRRRRAQRRSRTALVWEFLCQGCITPFLSCFVASFFCSTRAPRAFFRPDRILPSPSRTATVKDGACSAPPKACP